MQRWSRNSTLPSMLPYFLPHIQHHECLWEETIETHACGLYKNHILPLFTKRSTFLLPLTTSLLNSYKQAFCNYDCLLDAVRSTATLIQAAKVIVIQMEVHFKGRFSSSFTDRPRNMLLIMGSIYVWANIVKRGKKKKLKPNFIMYFILYFHPSLNPLVCFFVHELCIHGSYYVEERAHVAGHIPSFSCCWTKSLQTKPSVQIIKLRHFRQNNSGTEKRLHSSKIIFITSLLCHSKMFFRAYNKQQQHFC